MGGEASLVGAPEFPPEPPAPDATHQGQGEDKPAHYQGPGREAVTLDLPIGRVRRLAPQPDPNGYNHQGHEAAAYRLTQATGLPPSLRVREKHLDGQAAGRPQGVDGFVPPSCPSLGGSQLPPEEPTDG